MGNQPTVSGQQTYNYLTVIVLKSIPVLICVKFFYFLFLVSFFQPGSPPSRPYEAPTPGSGWANTPGGNYSEAGTPRDSSSAYGMFVQLLLFLWDRHLLCSAHLYVLFSKRSLIFSCLPWLILCSRVAANAPSPYLPSTPGGQPMTPNSASYLPGTPGGQPMTPGTGGLDVMSPVIGMTNNQVSD